MKKSLDLIKDACFCIGCGSRPVLFRYDDGLWYAECPKCRKIPKWSCLGATAQCAIDVWNNVNRPILGRGGKKCE